MADVGDLPPLPDPNDPAQDPALHALDEIAEDVGVELPPDAVQGVEEIDDDQGDGELSDIRDFSDVDGVSDNGDGETSLELAEPGTPEREAELAEVEVSDEQKRQGVYRHPDRETLHGFIRRGKTARWISEWLKERYPLEDKSSGSPHKNAVENRRWQLQERSIENYRRKFMPECDPGVDVVNAALEKIIGHKPPAPDGEVFELDILEAAISVSQHNLVRALEQDKEIGMLQPITLEAQKALIDSAKTRAELAQKLSRPGYEQAAKKLQIDQRTENLNVNYDVDGDGNRKPEEPVKIRMMRELMAMNSDDAARLVGTADDMARERMDDEETIDAEVVDDG